MDEATKIERKTNPRENANPISAIMYTYMFSIFKRSYKHGFKEEDLYKPLKEHESNKLGNKLENAWILQHRKHKKSALHRAVFKVFGLQFMFYGIVKMLIEMMLVGLLPSAIGGFVSQFDKTSWTGTHQDTFIFAGVILGCLVINLFFDHAAMMGLNHIGMKIRIACSSLLYRKSLRLTKAALTKTNVGQQINLLANDAGKFDQRFMLVHYVWISPIQTALGTYLIYLEIGIPAFYGISFILLFIPIQVILAKLISTLTLKAALRSDDRVRLMNEIISGIQVIKMYTWEKPFAKLIGIMRRKEIKEMRLRTFLLGMTYTFEIFLSRTSVFISILVFLYLGNKITAKTIFVLTAIYNVLRPSITMMFLHSISILAELNVSICRVQNYLSLEELPQGAINNYLNKAGTSKVTDSLPESVHSTKAQTVKPRILMKDVCAKYEEDSLHDTISNLNLDINSNQLVALIGVVGCGKSSLLNIILKELPISSGILEIEGRISYASQEPWLFVGSIRQNILFCNEYDEKRYNEVVRGCALQSDFAMLPYGDTTIIGEKGTTLSGGQKARVNLARCVYKKADIYLLDDPLSAVDSQVGKHLYEQCISKILRDKICILVTHQVQHLQNADQIIILQNGKTIGKGKFDELNQSGLDFAKLLAAIRASEEEETDTSPSKSVGLNAPVDDEETEQETGKEILETGDINTSTYFAYLKAGGDCCLITTAIILFLLTQAVAKGSDYYVAYWANEERTHNDMGNYSEFKREPIIYTYTGIICTTILLAVVHIIFFLMILMRASTRLHDYIFEKISQASMRFFNTNPSGRILNRFSKDIGVIDQYIPALFAEVIEIALYFVGTIALISVTNPWFVIPSAFLLVIFYFMRMVFLKTSRAVKRIEGITRSPIFGHMSASMYGILTIRAFSAQDILIKEFDNHQDLHSGAFYLFLTSGRCFGFWLDTMCFFFMTGVMLSLILVDQGYHGGDIGLVVTQLFGLVNYIQWGMRQWSELENQMTSVERVLEYTKVETEPIRTPISKIPEDWPQHGKIQYKNVSLHYKETGPATLKNMNFIIRPIEKVGIVGRTGAGKSSIVASLFQLYETEGSIIIDDIDITKIPQEILRTKISIIPQEPVLFSGTMRKNLDPFDQYSDDALWNALEQVELKPVVANLPSGLDCKVAEGGANFSVGQRQLVCLARAIIRNNKILVMDEATANVDPHTDAFIQRAIKKSFANCTVLTIAHRLHTVIDSDKILVMDKGRVMEFDHAFNLLRNKGGVFTKMVQMTGAATATNLEKIATEHFSKLNRS